jgi:preprotein translocase subunit SecG
MHALVSFITVVHVILCVLLVLAILVQQGKGAEISASFGGSSQTVFGSSGGANFFSTFTGVCAALFMFTSVFLATQGGSHAMSKSVMDVAVPATSSATTAPVAAAPVANPGTPSGATVPDQATQNAVEPGHAVSAPAAKPAQH